MTSYSGARWWKFDLHTHSPASVDFGKGSHQEELRKITPREWILAWMKAGIDCVSLTDHNSGEWIDQAQDALRILADEGNPEFREITLLPGVEITVSGGCHVLAVFAAGTTKSTIDSVLGAVGFRGNRGQTDTAADASVIDVIRAINSSAGLAILAHVDKEKGAGTLPGNTLTGLLAEDRLAAIELCGAEDDLPARVRRATLTNIVGSDAHHLEGSSGQCFPGSRFTWIKMGEPTLEGLRLALLDGNDFSVSRSIDLPEGTDPNAEADDWIESIRVFDAKLMGRGRALEMNLSPWLNAIVGGRGTGKSTVIHLLRETLDGTDELKRLEPGRASQTFQEFMKVGTHEGPGGLTEGTRVQIVLRHATKRYRVTWDNGERIVAESVGSEWHRAELQEVRARFPVRIFSQGQVLELSERPDALLQSIDTESGAEALSKEIHSEEQRFLTHRAGARELRSRLQGVGALRVQLEEVVHKLAAFDQTEHASLLREHQLRTRQRRAVEAIRDEAVAFAEMIDQQAAGMIVSDLDGELFGEEDQVTASARRDTDSLRKGLEIVSRKLAAAAIEVRAGAADYRDQQIHDGVGRASTEARQRYEALVEKLREEGVDDPSQFGELVEERQRLEGELANLDTIGEQLVEIETRASKTRERIEKLQHDRWVLRRNFVESKLYANKFVRITVRPHGAERLVVEQSLREVLGLSDDRFPEDRDGIVKAVNVPNGLEGDALEAEMRRRVEQIRVRFNAVVEGEDGEFGGHFRNFLNRETGKRPELFDRLMLWAPGDGVRVEYSARGDGEDFRPIEQGSAGQRSAALLAFFLAFGEGPIVLDQPEDDLDNHLIYDLIVKQLRESKRRRQLVVVTHNANIVVNGDAELVFAMDVRAGQCLVAEQGNLQEREVRKEVCRIMEGGDEAFRRRYKRLGGGRSG